jgi:hypothetical protein
MQSLSFHHLWCAFSGVVVQSHAFAYLSGADRREAGVSMNGLDRFAQILIAGVFLFAGLSKIFAFQRPTQLQTGPTGRAHELPPRVAYAIAIMEIAGALGLVMPLVLWQTDLLPGLAAVGLAILTLAVSIYYVRHKEPAAPMLALFCLTQLLIVGRWL